MEQILLNGSKALGLDLNDLQISALLQYLQFLRIWNHQINLCAAASEQHMVAYHLLDSLSILSKFNLAHKTIIDIGSGAGLPGIPLAIAVPTAKITLLDAKAKKIAFVRSAINNLVLSNVTAVLTRVEAYRPINTFDFVISRAFGSLGEFVTLSGHLCKPDGRLIIMKTDPKLFAKHQIIKLNYMVEQVIPIIVPYVRKDRCVVVVKKI